MAAGAGSAVKAGEAYYELKAVDNTAKGLKAAENHLKSFGQSLGAVGTGLAAAGVAITEPILALATNFAEFGAEMLHLSQQTGATVEEISALSFAAQRAGADADGMRQALLHMARTLAEAADGSQQAQQLLARLGLTFQDLQPLTTEQRFLAIADALNRIEDPGIRAGRALELFGRRGAALIPLTNLGAAGIRGMEEQAHALGRTLTTEEARALRSLLIDFNALTNGIKAASLAIAAGLVPGLRAAFANDRGVAAMIAQAGRAIGAFLGQHQDLVKILFLSGLAMIAFGGAIRVVGTLIPWLSRMLYIGRAAVLAFNAALWLTNPVVLAVVGGLLLGIGAAGLLLYALGELGPAANGLGEAFTTMGDDFQEAWRGIQDTIAAGRLDLALNIMGATFRLEWLRLTTFLQDTWEAFKWFFFNTCIEIARFLAVTIARVIQGARLMWARVTNLSDVAFAAESIRIGQEAQAQIDQVNRRADAAAAAQTGQAAAIRLENQRAVQSAQDDLVAAIQAASEAAEATRHGHTPNVPTLPGGAALGLGGASVGTSNPFAVAGISGSNRQLEQMISIGNTQIARLVDVLNELRGRQPVVFE